MPNGYTADQIPDLVQLTHQTYDKDKITNLILGRQKLWAYNLCEQHSESTDGGSFYQFNLLVDGPDNTTEVGYYSQDSLEQKDINQKGYVSPTAWQTGYQIEHRILAQNQGEQAIINYVREQEEAMWTKHWNTFETWMFTHRAAQNTQRPENFWYYMPVDHTGAAGDLTTDIGDFTGGNYFTGVNTANVDPTVVPNYKSYNKKYADVSESDFVRKLFVATNYCQWENPVPVSGMQSGMPSRGYYTTMQVLSNLRTLSRSNNDNLGFDFASPLPTYAGHPINWLPVLTTAFPTMQPFLGIDWNWMKFRKNSNLWRKETFIKNKADEHMTSQYFYNWEGQLICRNRRTSFVLAKNALYN